MLMRVAVPLLGLGLLLAAHSAWAQESKPPDWKHGLEFQVRKAAEKEFTDKTKAYGCEAYADLNNNALFYLTETGAIAVVAGGNFTPGAKVLPPRLLGGTDLKIRKVGEPESGADAKRFGMEIFRDENAGTLVYITEIGSLAGQKGDASAGPRKGLKSVHGLELRVRKAGEKDFTEKTQRLAVEVFVDENTNNLIYLSEAGYVALAPPAAAGAGGEAKGPKWSHGLELPVRKAGEADFTPQTARRSVEVFRDENTGHLIYISETGSLAVVPGAGFAGVQETKPPKRLYAMECRVRKAGEAKFAMAKKWGIEVYRDENTGHTVYITESGALAVLPK